jgi:hypothetical protein
MPSLIRWNTPFTDSKWPSVIVAVDQKLRPEQQSSLMVIVAPQGIDEYPKYIVNFGEVIAFTCMEEAFCPERDYYTTTIEEPELAAYQYVDSPWLKAYENGRHFIARGHLGEFFHYLIFGGDDNVEVITPYLPTIEIIEHPKILRIDFEV